ncbi:MAG: hypothetical protein HKN81_08170 [Gammaproteobacteria bacterium]|nr:hypothetical protein [Gammaproteobacteria bacterium]
MLTVAMLGAGRRAMTDSSTVIATLVAMTLLLAPRALFSMAVIRRVASA